MHRPFGNVLLSAVVAFTITCPAAAQSTADSPTASLDRDLLFRWPTAMDKTQLLGEHDPRVEIPAAKAPRLGARDFTLSAWVRLADDDLDVPGDLVSQYDPQQRRGFHLGIKTNAGVTTTQANRRQLQFGIDHDQQTPWTDCGRPGQAVLAFALAAHDGALWAATCEPGADQAGRVYRYAEGKNWIDCGAPAACNAVTALAEYEGALYAGTGKYRLGGSALAESENPHLGGAVYRYEQGVWIHCGQLPGVEAIGGMVVYGGRLYASSLYRPSGFFRYEGDTRWTSLPTPEARVEALCVHDGHLYASSYDGGHVYRFDGQSWNDCGQLGDAAENTQTYSFAVYHGRLHVGTWRSGRVYRFEDLHRWTDVGRLGEELEVMGMLVHNGRLIAGTLPLAEVYAYQGNQDWQRLARLDHTPDVTYRRAWTMAEHDGRVFCSTLPSGHVYSYQAGTSAMAGTPFPAGWHHVAAVRDDDHLRLFVDGRLVASSNRFDPRQYDLDVDVPLRLGDGPNDALSGQLADVRVYGRALSAAQLAALAAQPPAAAAAPSAGD